jgi:hypothetical protein
MVKLKTIGISHHTWSTYQPNSYLSQKSVLGLELLSEIHSVVDEAEPSGLATSKVGLEAKGEDPVGGAVVHLGQLLTDLRMIS